MIVQLFILQKRALCFMCIPLFLHVKTLPIHFLCYKLLGETMHDVNNDVFPSQLKDFFHSYHKNPFRHIIHDLQFPTTLMLKNQNLRLNENHIQELVQNCRMRYQLSSAHYQNSSLKGKFI